MLLSLNFVAMYKSAYMKKILVHLETNMDWDFTISKQKWEGQGWEFSCRFLNSLRYITLDRQTPQMWGVSLSSLNDKSPINQADQYLCMDCTVLLITNITHDFFLCPYRCLRKAVTRHNEASLLPRQ